MALECPACGGPLSVPARWMTSMSSPAECAGCGMRVAAKPGLIQTGLGVIVGHLLLLGALVAAVYWTSWWPLVLCTVLLFGLEPLEATFSPLVEVTPGKVRRARRIWQSAWCILAAAVLYFSVFG